jgi:hypothetical protein
MRRKEHGSADFCKPRPRTGASAYAIAHFPLDLPSLSFLYDHIADELHHSVEMIEWAGRYNPGKNYWEADPDWEGYLDALEKSGFFKQVLGK